MRSLGVDYIATHIHLHFCFAAAVAERDLRGLRAAVAAGPLARVSLHPVRERGVPEQQPFGAGRPSAARRRHAGRRVRRLAARQQQHRRCLRGSPQELTQLPALFVIFPFLSQSLTRLLIFRERRQRLVSPSDSFLSFFFVSRWRERRFFFSRNASIWAHC
jgi:hypothetical protein